MVDEFNEIFESLFSHSTSHIQIVKTLAQTRKGLTRDKLLKKAKLPSGGPLTKALHELNASGFISEYPSIGKKRKMTLYRLSDEYSNFYLKYIAPNKNQGNDFWKTMFQKQSYITWAGFNFETICLKHIPQIKSALKISGIHSVNTSWSTKDAQIDLVIVRNDNWINICEIKFHSKEYIIGLGELKNLQNKINQFKAATKTKSTVVLTLITTYGVAQNDHFFEIVEDNFTMEILFRKE